MGRCQYVLAKDSENKFEVLQKNEICNGVATTCTNAITVTVKGLKIHVAKGGQLTVFGISVRLPYNNRGKKMNKGNLTKTKLTLFILDNPISHD